MTKIRLWLAKWILPKTYYISRMPNRAPKIRTWIDPDAALKKSLGEAYERSKTQTGVVI